MIYVYECSVKKSAGVEQSLFFFEKEVTQEEAKKSLDSLAEVDNSVSALAFALLGKISRKAFENPQIVIAEREVNNEVQ